GMDTVIGTARDHHVEFSRQIGKGTVSHKVLREGLRQRRRIDEFGRIEPCQGTSHDIADVVHAGLERRETDGIHRLKERRHRFNLVHVCSFSINTEVCLAGAPSMASVLPTGFTSQYKPPTKNPPPTIFPRITQTWFHRNPPHETAASCGRNIAKPSSD